MVLTSAGRLSGNGPYECEVGGVFNVCYFAPKNINDVVNNANNAKEKNVPSDGQIFPYIAHYLITGDLIYPIHEGEGRVSALLEELSRMDLLRQLFPHQQGGKTGGKENNGKEMGKNISSGGKLRVRTRNEGWHGMTKAVSRLFHFRRRADRAQVYRPPPKNKGTSLVVVRKALQGQNHVKVHGPVTALRTLIPEASTLSHQQTHHHLNGHLTPTTSSAHALVMRLEEMRFDTTVRSSWAESQSGALITQWIMYRRGSNKKLSSTSRGTSRSSSLSKVSNSRKCSLATPSSTRKISGSSRTKKRSLLPRTKNDDGVSATNADDFESSNAIDGDIHLSGRNSISGTGLDLFHGLVNKGTIPRSLSVGDNREKSIYSSCTLPTLKSAKDDTKNSGDAFAKLRQKSFSISSIAPPQKNASNKEGKNGIWNVCSKASVKRVLSVLF